MEKHKDTAKATRAINIHATPFPCNAIYVPVNIRPETNLVY